MTVKTSRRGNGEGSAISQRKDGRYVAAIRYDDAQGRPKRAYIYGRTRKEVQEKLREARRRVEDGRPAVDATVTLEAFAARWVGTSLAASDRAPSTKELYATLLRAYVLPHLGAVRLDQLRPTHVEGLIAALKEAGKAGSTIRSSYTVLRQMLETAVRDGQLVRNPAAAVQRPRAPRTREVEALDAGGVRAVLAAAEGHRLHPLLVLLAHTGLRRGEALALTWSDVDLDAARVTVRGSLRRAGGGQGLVVGATKTAKSRRSVPLTAQAAAALRAHKVAQASDRLRVGAGWEDTGHVFTTEAGGRLDPRNVARWIATLPTPSGRPLHPHVLRHSAATVLLEAGVAVPVVGDLLGHSSYSVTADVYSHVLDKMRDQAADALGAAFAADA